MIPRDKQETTEDERQEILYADLLVSRKPEVAFIEKLNPFQYGIDWVAYNEKMQVLWWAEFKRRHRPLQFFQEKHVIGISAYKVIKLREFVTLGKKGLVIFGLNDCILIGDCIDTATCGLKKGGNPNPKDKWEREPLVFYKTDSLRHMAGAPAGNDKQG